jgi:hypothetical protein
MDFPRFDGTNPEEWLRMIEKYFGMVYVPEVQNLIMLSYISLAVLILGSEILEF